MHIRRLTGEPRLGRLPFFLPVLAAVTGLCLLGAATVPVLAALAPFLLVYVGRAVGPGRSVFPLPAIAAGIFEVPGRPTAAPRDGIWGFLSPAGTDSGGGGRRRRPKEAEADGGPGTVEDGRSGTPPPDVDSGAYGDVIRVARAQRHRFLNHLQVISGWLQLEKPPKALSYIDRVRREMEGHSPLFKLDAPELVARMLTEAATAEGNGCNVTFELDGEPERLSSLMRGWSWLPRATARALSILAGFARLVGDDDSDPIIVRFSGGESGLRVTLSAPWPAAEGAPELCEMAGEGQVRRLSGLKQAAAAAGGRVEFSALAGEGLRLVLETPAAAAGRDEPEVR